MSRQESPDWKSLLSKPFDAESAEHAKIILSVDSPACLVPRAHPTKKLINIASLRLNNLDAGVVIGQIVEDFKIVPFNILRDNQSSFVAHTTSAVEAVDHNPRHYQPLTESYFLARSINHVFDRAEDMDPANAGLLREVHRDRLLRIGQCMVNGAYGIKSRAA